MGKSRKTSRERRYEYLTTILQFLPHSCHIFLFISWLYKNAAPKLKATVVYISRSRSYSWSPAREQRERSQRSASRRRSSSRSVKCYTNSSIQIDKLFDELDSHRNTVISHAVMASKTVTRSSLLLCATVSEGVNSMIIENNASDTLYLTDLKGHFSLLRSRKSQSKRSMQISFTESSSQT